MAVPSPRSWLPQVQVNLPLCSWKHFRASSLSFSPLGSWSMNPASRWPALMLGPELFPRGCPLLGQFPSPPSASSHPLYYRFSLLVSWGCLCSILVIGTSVDPASASVLAVCGDVSPGAVISSFWVVFRDTSIHPSSWATLPIPSIWLLRLFPSLTSGVGLLATTVDGPSPPDPEDSSGALVYG